MSTLRFAYKVATFGTYAWLGWKLASLDTRIAGAYECIDDTDGDAFALAERVTAMERRETNAELALMWEGR